MAAYVIIFTVLFLENILNTHCSADFLNVEAFRRDVTSHFVLFYAPWCGHCKQLIPTWNELADKAHERNSWNSLKITKVNCAEDTTFCSAQNIVAYPTMKLFHNGEIRRFDGQRSLGYLEVFIEHVLHDHFTALQGGGIYLMGLLAAVSQFNVQIGTVFDKELCKKFNVKEEEGLFTLTTEYFDAHIKEGIGLHFVDFYAPWCVHCQRFEPTWKAIAKHYQYNPDITIGKMDCTLETSKCKKWGVDSYPTLAMFKDGNLVDTYQGKRDIESVKTYINDLLYQHGLRQNEDREAETTPNEPPTDTHSNMDGNPDDHVNSNAVVELHDRTFDIVVDQQPVFINFYTPWSKESKAFVETWEKLGKLCQRQRLTTIARIDCSRYPQICKKLEIIHYPTLILFQQGQRFHYNEDKTMNSLYRFVKQHFHEEL